MRRKHKHMTSGARRNAKRKKQGENNQTSFGLGKPSKEDLESLVNERLGRELHG